MGRTRAIAAMLVVGCGGGCGDGGPVVGISDGRRLEAHFFDGGDGARVFRTWVDTDLGGECTFRMASDGRYRCLPSGPTTRPIYDFQFSDSACTRPIVILEACEPDPTDLVGMAVPTPACAETEGVRVFALGAQRASTTWFAKESSGACVPAGQSAGRRVFDVGEERSPARFVAADLRRDGTARVVPFSYFAEDGAVQAVSAWDTQRDGECGPGGTEGDLRCAPSEIALHYDFQFADATCTTYAAVDLARNRPCAVPTAVIGDAEPFGSAFLEIGGEIPRENVYRGENGTCAPETSTFPDAFYLEGAPIANASLPPLTEVRDGAGRLRAERYTDADGHALAASAGFRDTTFDQSCYPSLFPDGTRCVPTASERGDTFADAACATPIVAAGDSTVVAIVGHTPADECDRVSYDFSYSLAAPFNGTTIYLRANGTCTAATRDPAQTFRLLGERIDLPLLGTP